MVMADLCETPSMPSVDLRPIKIEDVTEDYQNWLYDSEVNKFLEVRHSDRSMEALKSYIQGAIENPILDFYAIIASDKKLMVGTLSLLRHAVYPVAYYGYLVGNKDYWGTTVSLEAQIAIAF